MDQTPTLYRVAHMSSICRGLYDSNSARAHLNEFGRHPMPYDDAKLELFYAEQFVAGMYFAFGSREQLRCWVYQKEVRAALANEGYVVYEIEPIGERGKHWQIGDTQAIYSQCREIGIRDIRDI